MNVHFVGCSNDYKKQIIDFINAFESGQQIFEQATSGSTGSPKIIQITHEQFTASALSTIEYLGLKSHQTVLVCLPVQYIAGKMMLVRAMLAQMNALVVEPTAFPFDFEEVATATIHFTALTPYQLTRIFERNYSNDYEYLEKIEHVLVGGEAMPYPLELKLQIFKNAQFYATFATTETVSHFALRKINRAPDACYWPLPGVEIATDSQQRLRVKSPVTHNKWLQTNDMVQIVNMNDQTGFQWLGRADFVVNSGGIKVQAEAVEAIFDKVFTELSLTHPFFIYKTPHLTLQEAVTLFIEAKQPFSHSQVEEIKNKATQMAPNKYYLPKKVIFMKEFIRTGNGKIDRILSAKAHERFI